MKSLFLTLAALFLFPSCRQEGMNNDPKVKKVVVYTSLDRVHSQPVFKVFEKQTGIKVLAVYDTEAAKTVGLVNRLIAESNRPRADVFWNSEVLRTLILKKKGILASYQSPEASHIPDSFKDPEHCWTGFAARSRVFFYNTKLVTSPPTHLQDLLKPEWKNRVAIANPLFGTTNTQLATWWSQWGPDRTKDFLTALKANGTRIVPGNGPARDLVASGEIALCLTDTDDAWQAIRKKRPVAMAYLNQSDEGTLLIPNTVALIKGGPHPETAKTLIDFLLSEQTEELLAFSESAQIPVRESVKRPPHVHSLDAIHHQSVDFQKISEQIETASEWAQNHFLE